MSIYRKITALLSVATLATLCTTAVLAQEHAHDHSHEPSEPAQLTLNHGQKWATDDSLRLGMSRIRDALSARLHTIHSGEMTASQYRLLAQEIDGQIAFMIKNCKLDPQVDTMLHLVLADIMAGTENMASGDQDKSHQGVARIVHALENYAGHFEHPDWHGLK